MKLSKEQVTVAKTMKDRGTSVRQLARQLGVTEGALRYRLKTVGGEQTDGRASQPTALDGYEQVVVGIQDRLEDGRLTGEGRPAQAREIYEVLVRDHGYEGSYQAVVRHLRRRYGAPKVRALRRVETPAGVQAQHDSFEIRVPLGGKARTLQALLGTLSHSRARFCWVSHDQSQLAWHTETFRRGTGCLEELQYRLDAAAEALLDRLECPVIGTSVRAAWEAEWTLLQPLPNMGEPFDVMVARKVQRDCLVSSEGRRHSVPFPWVGRWVDIWGTLNHVVIRAEGQEIARHVRHTPERLLLDPLHYEGASTDRVERPTPLGRRGRLQVAGLSSPSRRALLQLPTREGLARPLDAYVQLVEALQ